MIPCIMTWRRLGILKTNSIYELIFAFVTLSTSANGAEPIFDEKAFREAYQSLTGSQYTPNDSKKADRFAAPTFEIVEPKSNSGNVKSTKPKPGPPEKNEPTAPNDSDAPPIVDPESVPKFIEFEKQPSASPSPEHAKQ